MAIAPDVEAALTAKFDSLMPHLDERQRRLLMGAEARVLGHGGIKVVARAAGVNAVTVSKGAAELESGADPLKRVRQPGGGRKPQTVKDPGLLDALLALVDPDERGDPLSPLRWTTKSTRTLADELSHSGHPVSAWTVANLLHDAGAQVTIHDPKGIENARRAYPHFAYETRTADAVRGAEAVLHLTEWREYRAIEPRELLPLVANPLIIDGRNVLDAALWASQGWTIRAPGRAL